MMDVSEQTTIDLEAGSEWRFELEGDETIAVRVSGCWQSGSYSSGKYVSPIGLLWVFRESLYVFSFEFPCENADRSFPIWAIPLIDCCPSMWYFVL